MSNQKSTITQTKPHIARRTSTLKKGGSEQGKLACMLEAPVGMLWNLILSKKHVAFTKKIVPMATQIAEVVYKGCPLDGSSCKTTKVVRNHAHLNAIKEILGQFPKPANANLLDDETVVAMVVQFMQAVYLPIGRITMNMDAFTGEFVEFMNTITRDDYVASYCEARDDVSVMSTKLEKDTYTCGRAISAIPYSCNPQGKPRILIHRTMGRTDDMQDYMDPIKFADEQCKQENSMFVETNSNAVTYRMSQCKISGGKKKKTPIIKQTTSKKTISRKST